MVYSVKFTFVSTTFTCSCLFCQNYGDHKRITSIIANLENFEDDLGVFWKFFFWK